MVLASPETRSASTQQSHRQGNVHLGVCLPGGGRMMTSTTALDEMVDVQNAADDRNIPIDQVGVTDLRYPIVVLDRQQERQQTTATLTMSVSLPHHFKGTHMSRF